MVAKSILYRNKKYVLAMAVPRMGPLTQRKTNPEMRGVFWDLKIELMDKDGRLMFKPVVDFDTINNRIWFFEDIHAGIKRQLDQGNDLKFMFKNKEYAIEEISKTNDLNYYMVARVTT